MMNIMRNSYSGNLGAEAGINSPNIVAGDDLQLYANDVLLTADSTGYIRLPNATRNAPYRVVLKGKGGSGKFVFNYSGGVVRGLAYTTDGLIVGDPQIGRNEIGNQTLDITMTDTETRAQLIVRNVFLTINDDGTAPGVPTASTATTAPATTTAVVAAIQSGATVTPYNDGKYLVSFPNGSQFLYNSEGILISRGQGSAFAAVSVGYSQAYQQWMTIQQQLPATASSSSVLSNSPSAIATTSGGGIIDDVKNFVADNKWYLIGGGAVLGYFYFKED